MILLAHAGVCLNDDFLIPGNRERYYRNEHAKAERQDDRESLIFVSSLGELADGSDDQNGNGKVKE